MRLFLNAAAIVLLGTMLVQPLLVKGVSAGFGLSDASLVVLGALGLALGHRGARRAADRGA